MTEEPIAEMQQYYIHDGNTQSGPFTIEELQIRGISASTPVWYEGLPDWTTAGELDELKPYIRTSVPPPFRGTPSQALTPPVYVARTDPAGSNIRVGINAIWALVIIAALVIGTVVITKAIRQGRAPLSSSEETSTDSFSGTPKSSTEIYKERVRSVAAIEKSRPLKFLSTTGSWNFNLLNTIVRIHGEIANASTVTTYSNTVLEVRFLDADKNPLSTSRDTLEENIPPQKSTPFELKLKKPAGTRDVEWKIVAAKPVEGEHK